MITAQLERKTLDLLSQPNFAHLSSHRADGTIHSVVVWIDVRDDGRIFVNSAEGRVWPANVDRDPRVTVSVHNRNNPYEFASITGRVIDRDTETGDADIDALALKYMGAETYPFRKEGEVRVTFTIEPERVTHHGA